MLISDFVCVTVNETEDDLENKKSDAESKVQAAREWRLWYQRMRLTADLRDSKHLNTGHHSAAYWAEEERRIERALKDAKHKIDDLAPSDSDNDQPTTKPAANNDSDSDSPPPARRVIRRQQKQEKKFLRTVYRATDGKTAIDPVTVQEATVRDHKAWKERYARTEQYMYDQPHSRHYIYAKNYIKRAPHRRPENVRPGISSADRKIQIDVTTPLPNYDTNRLAQPLAPTPLGAASSAGAGVSVLNRRGASDLPGTALLRTATAGITGVSGRVIMPGPDSKLTHHAIRSLVAGVAGDSGSAAAPAFASAASVAWNADVPSYELKERLGLSHLPKVISRPGFNADSESLRRELWRKANTKTLSGTVAAGRVDRPCIAPTVDPNQHSRDTSLGPVPNRALIEDEFASGRGGASRRSVLERHLQRVSARIGRINQSSNRAGVQRRKGERPRRRAAAMHGREKRQPKRTATTETREEIERLQAAVVHDRIVASVIGTGGGNPKQKIAPETLKQRHRRFDSNRRTQRDLKAFELTRQPSAESMPPTDAGGDDYGDDGGGDDLATDDM